MDYWHAIINVLNRICPCPDQSNDSEQSHKEENHHILSNLSHVLSFYKGKMSACLPKSTPKSVEEQPLLHEEYKQNLEKEKTDMEPEFIEKVLIDISLKEYGPPRYGMSKSSWTLLILARRAVEETIFGILNLKLPRYANY